MKVLAAVLCLSLVLAVFSQRDVTMGREAEQKLKKKEAPNPAQDPLGNIRVQYTGMIGQDPDNLNKRMGGWLTHLSANTIELTHVEHRTFNDESASSDMSSNPSPASAIFQMFQFYDSATGYFRSFFLNQKNETDVGTCLELLADKRSSQISNWRQTGDKCGENDQGMVFSRTYGFVDQNRKQNEWDLSVCVSSQSALSDIAQPGTFRGAPSGPKGMTLTAFTGEGRVSGQTAIAMMANVTRVLPQPSLNDRATFNELAVPFVCDILQKPFDMDALSQLLFSGREPQDTDTNLS